MTTFQLWVLRFFLACVVTVLVSPLRGWWLIVIVPASLCIEISTHHWKVWMDRIDGDA